MESRERSAAIGIVTPVVIFLLTFAVFFPTLAAGFVDLDDFALLIENDKWRGLGWGNIKWMFTTTLLGHYQPLTWLSYAVTYEFAGMDPSAYHFGNVVIHAVNGVLVYFVAMRLIRAGMPDRERFPEHRVRMAAGVGALAWAVHPLRVESVAWVTERRDVLSAMFLVLAVLAYLRKVRVKGARGAKGIEVGGTDFDGTGWVRPYVWSIGLLVLSLLSKPWGMSFFVMVLVLDWYPLRRLHANPLRWLSGPYRGVLVEKVPYVVLGVVFMISAGMSANSAAMAMRTYEEWPLASRVAQAAYGLVFYVRKMAAPADLAVLYELRHGLNPLAIEYVLCYLVIVVAVVGAVALRRRVPALMAAGLIYAAMVAPVLGFFQSGDQFVADRYSYLANIGWSVLAGVGVALAVRWASETKKLHAGVIAAGVGALLLTAGVLTMNQGVVWRDSLALWEHAVEVGHGTPYVRVNYGLNLERRAQLDDRLTLEQKREFLERAVEQFALATRDRPEDGKAAFCMGNTLRKLGRFEEAAAAYREAAKVLPQAFTALVSRGNTLINDLGRKEEGLASLRAAVTDLETPRTGAAARRPVSGMPHLALGAALNRAGDVEGAKASFREALRYPDARAAAEADLRKLGERP